MVQMLEADVNRYHYAPQALGLVIAMHFDVPTAFDELRYGYFDTAFSNILKAIRGGANPIAVTTLAMCSIGAWSEIDWVVSNQQYL